MKDEVIPYRFIVEPPTLLSLGFEWFVEGDDNHNATVEVRYRKEGDGKWKRALPLLRIQNDESNTRFLSNSIDYVTPNMFAGSILDMEPDTTYECRFQMFDPDGVVGEAQKTVKGRTTICIPPFLFRGYGKRPSQHPCRLRYFFQGFPCRTGKPYNVYSPDNLNFSLKSYASAVDAGCILPQCK